MNGDDVVPRDDSEEVGDQVPVSQPVNDDDEEEETVEGEEAKDSTVEEEDEEAI